MELLKMSQSVAGMHHSMLSKYGSSGATVESWGVVEGGEGEAGVRVRVRAARLRRR